MVYLITYDINTAIKDYNEMYDAIKSISNDYQHPLESVWLVNTQFDKIKVYDIVHEKMSSKDFLLIVEVKGTYYGWLNTKVWEWLKDRLGY